MNIQLLVLRTGDIKRLADFYSLLGMTFDYHKHGRSPYHYSGTIGQAILEIYPLAKGQSEADKNLRLGLVIDDFDTTIEGLKKRELAFSADPSQTNFGFMAIITDPDGRKIELYKNEPVK